MPSSAFRFGVERAPQSASYSAPGGCRAACCCAIPIKTIMHIHATQPNPYAQLDALRSAQRTAAKREAESVRKELLESASELYGDSDVSDLSVDADERNESQRQPRRKNKNKGPAEQKPSEAGAADSEDARSHISDWA